MRRLRPSAMSLTLWSECKEARLSLRPTFREEKYSGIAFRFWASNLRRSSNGDSGSGMGDLRARR